MRKYILFAIIFIILANIGFSEKVNIVCSIVTSDYTPIYDANITIKQYMPYSLSDVLQLSLGIYHTVALTKNGYILSWGANYYGQLGDGTTDERYTPVQVVGINNAIHISSGFEHSCALLSNGTIYCWGANYYGQLGIGSDDNNPHPIPTQVIGLTNVVNISSGYYHNCAIKRDGTVWCWGYNLYGQLGDGTRNDRYTPVQVQGLSNVVQIALGNAHSCALKSDGTVYCWGYNYFGQLGDGTTDNRYTPVQVQGLSNVVQIALGAHHSCALKSDGTVWCWGANYVGQLGDGTTDDRYTPVQVQGLSNVVQIALGGYHSCALKSDGTVWCWGGNYWGQLGDGTTDERYTPVQVVGINNAIHISSGFEHSCALLSNGTIYCWGRNDFGQLGVGYYNIDPNPYPLPVVGGEPTVYICLHGESLLVDTGTYVLDVNFDYDKYGFSHYESSGDIHIVDESSKTTTVEIFGDGSIIAFLYQIIVPPPPTIYYIYFNATDQFGRFVPLSVYIDGNVYSAGSVIPLTRGTHSIQSFIPVEYRYVFVRWISKYGNITISDPYNSFASIEVNGNDTLTLVSKYVPKYKVNCYIYTTAYTPVYDAYIIFNTKTLDEMAPGFYITCGMTYTGSIYCWGENVGATPVRQESITGVIQMSCGDGFCCYVHNYGNRQVVSCFGDSLGKSYPLIFDVDVIQVASGFRHACALLANGSVYCWGINIFGQIGVGSFSEYDSGLVINLTDVVQISAGVGHTCAVKKDGTVWCWGKGKSGELGGCVNPTIIDNTRICFLDNSSVPVQVENYDGTPFTDVEEIAAGAIHTCALKKDGTVWCWGYNLYGQLGMGTEPGYLKIYPNPKMVVNLYDVVSVSTKGHHVCALKKDGTVWCWGYNLYGQLGDGTTIDKPYPVQVINLIDIEQVWTGDYHTCAIKKDGPVYCWGRNDYGQLGIGYADYNPHPIPERVLTDNVSHWCPYNRFLTSIPGSYGLDTYFNTSKYTFSRYSYQGDVYILDPNKKTTTIYINGNGVVTAFLSSGGFSMPNVPFINYFGLDKFLVLILILVLGGILAIENIIIGAAFALSGLILTFLGIDALAVVIIIFSFIVSYVIIKIIRR